MKLLCQYCLRKKIIPQNDFPAKWGWSPLPAQYNFNYNLKFIHDFRAPDDSDMEFYTPEVEAQLLDLRDVWTNIKERSVCYGVKRRATKLQLRFVS